MWLSCQWIMDLSWQTWFFSNIKCAAASAAPVQLPDLCTGAYGGFVCVRRRTWVLFSCCQLLRMYSLMRNRKAIPIFPIWGSKKWKLLGSHDKMLFFLQVVVDKPVGTPAIFRKDFQSMAIETWWETEAWQFLCFIFEIQSSFSFPASETQLEEVVFLDQRFNVVFKFFMLLFTICSISVPVLVPFAGL